MHTAYAIFDRDYNGLICVCLTAESRDAALQENGGARKCYAVETRVFVAG